MNIYVYVNTIYIYIYIHTICHKLSTSPSSVKGCRGAQKSQPIVMKKLKENGPDGHGETLNGFHIHSFLLWLRVGFQCCTLVVHMFLLPLILEAFHSMFRFLFVLLILRYQGCTVCFEGKPWSTKNDRVGSWERAKIPITSMAWLCSPGLVLSDGSSSS